MEHRIRLALIIKLAARLDLKAHVVVEATSLRDVALDGGDFRVRQEVVGGAHRALPQLQELRGQGLSVTS